MGCASAKQLSSVPGDEEDREKAHSNGDAFSSDEYKMKGVEKVKYLHGEEERMNTRNQEHLEKSTFLHKDWELWESRGHRDVTDETCRTVRVHSPIDLVLFIFFAPGLTEIRRERFAGSRCLAGFGNLEIRRTGS
ncbi:uncharacterized protein zgc:55943 isoform X1 [Trichomycterus rosablanca]|uniref:uncharacterized protein zgc:55943 isoform X1 n=1 Tax=Trichomycterus rosablanca TaxID=2290929 RepID=UPI002F35C35A